MKRHWGLGALALLSLLVALTSSAQAAVEDQEPVLTKVILTYRVALGASSDQSRTEAGQAVEQLSGTISHEYRHIPIVAAEVPTESLAALKADPRFARVELDGVMQALDLELDNSWGVDRIGTSRVHRSLPELPSRGSNRPSAGGADLPAPAVAIDDHRRDHRRDRRRHYNRLLS